MVKNKEKGEICKYCIVKRRGHTEEFDERKVYASCYAACLSSHVEHMEAEKISEKVTKEIKTWARKKKRVDSSEIFKKVIVVFKKHNEDAGIVKELSLNTFPAFLVNNVNKFSGVQAADKIRENFCMLNSVAECALGLTKSLV